ncbi:ATP-binding protein [Tropicimonas isoalkanivorans]|uniref:Anti-sigma regulatory factor (Ser/Thr protein kinase) n=1 Tax=Tropicimonas isoalkanivorans TaxID=441112 RepID=A0A1I1Q996_9RHOB|nr:ATP-binding protein [Tropicimonas isoalkanivorans]SFD18645.1 Anti-sigma regulatory factor (Ser/Thr protein kinase) [Tropicimonas isoalkanivorans]
MRWIDIEDRSAVAAMRRIARRCASSMGMTERRQEELAIVVTEAATNILRHAGRGRALVEVIQKPGVHKLVVLFADNGPGIGDLDRMMNDGQSTLASAGLGLGALRRLSDSFDVFTSADAGTTIVCAFDQDKGATKPPIEVAGLCVCHPAESVCGDAWTLRQGPQETGIVLCDGLGHGPLAARAAAEVLEGAEASPMDPGALIEEVSRRLVGKRGAVASAIRIDHEAMTMTYSGLGNISTLHVGPSGFRRLAVRDGRIGGPATRGYEETIALAPGDTVILHSDGLKTLREANIPPGLMYRSPLLIAGYFLDRMFRGRDDASIVLARVKVERE